jgi:putative tRNA adenosine deaminase-associated protein
MSYFAAVLARSGNKWTGTEVSLADCESIDDLADIARDVDGDIRLLIIEQDDEYAVIARVDADEEARVFLTDGHAADGYPLAAIVAEELVEIGEPELDDDPDAPPAHDSAPFGDPSVVEDLGTSAGELLALCAHEGTLPVDVILAVCDRAGCSDAFDVVRA